MVAHCKGRQHQGGIAPRPGAARSMREYRFQPKSTMQTLRLLPPARPVPADRRTRQPFPIRSLEQHNVVAGRRKSDEIRKLAVTE
jgi:hypothetical protein